MKACMKDDQVTLENVPQSKPGRVSILTYVLVAMFGTGSWLAMNGIWVELPNLVNEVPEKWHLPSYLTVICQLANLGPILYSLFLKCVRRKSTFLHAVVYFSLILGILACVLMAFTWKMTALIGSKETSVALMGSTFLIALVDCTSSVTFLPYMVILPSLYMSPLYIGETLSGLVPGVLALVQGSWKSSNVTSTDARGGNDSHGLLFPQDTFFALLGLLMFLSLIAFLCLNKLPQVRMHHIQKCRDSPNPVTEASEENNAERTAYDHLRLLDAYSGNMGVKILLFILVLLNAFQNGITASISSYTYAPYGQLTYHFAATLGSISSALACFLYLWFPCKSKNVIYIDTAVYTLFVGYIVFLATQSPNPWLKDALIGRIIIVMVSIVSSGLVSFTKLAIASVMRDCGEKHLFWAGVSNQVGSFLGAVVMFPLVNYTNIFGDS